MQSSIEIPREPLAVHHNSGGFLPDISLHQRGEVFYHGVSNSHFWFLGFTSVAALVLALLPWHTKVPVGGELKYWFAGMSVLAGLIDVVGSFIAQSFRQDVTIDRKNKTLSISGNDLSAKLSWENILGIQICRQKDPENSEMNGYQLNLVWKDAKGTVKRHCLYKHAIKGFVLRLGRRYESLFGFTLFDHT